VSETFAITNELAHVTYEENRFVREVTCVGENRYQSDFVISGTHRYLYENPEIASHVSGTTFFEVSRQLMKAVGHIYYSVPLNSRFTLQKVSIDFVQWGRIGSTISAMICVRPPLGKKSIYGHYNFQIDYVDSGQLLGRFIVDATALSSSAEKRLISKQFSDRSG
jgi:hypothetical protein